MHQHACTAKHRQLRSVWHQVEGEFQHGPFLSSTVIRRVYTFLLPPLWKELSKKDFSIHYCGKESEEPTLNIVKYCASLTKPSPFHQYHARAKLHHSSECQEWTLVYSLLCIFIMFWVFLGTFCSIFSNIVFSFCLSLLPFSLFFSFFS